MLTGMTPRIWLAAAEASGDALGAALAQELLRRLPHARLAGMAGPRMRAAGVQAVREAEQVQAVGLVEVVGRLPELWRLLRALDRQARWFEPHVAVTIDSPDLMLRHARGLKRRGIPVAHWVSPQVWAWRPRRARTIGACVDKVLCLLPFEPEIYAAQGVEAEWVGHPAATLRQTVPRDRCVRVILAPGSRPSEVRRHWPVLREVAAELRREVPDARFVVPVAPTVSRNDFGGLDAVYVHGLERAARGAHVAVVASGTATVELAAHGVPMVVVYQVHRLTHWLAQRLVRVPWVALPNLVLGREAVPERVQDLSATPIARAAVELLAEAGEAQRRALAEVVERLGGEGAVARTADAVVGMMAARGLRVAVYSRGATTPRRRPRSGLPGISGPRRA